MCPDVRRCDELNAAIGETAIYAPPGVKTSIDFVIPETMRAWVLGDPGELKLIDKKVPVSGKAEVLVRVDAVAICATDLEVIEHGPPAMIQGGLPFNKNFTPGHEYMGTVVALGPGVDYVLECSAAPTAVNDAIRMVNRGGKVCLAAFPHGEASVDVAHIVRNNIYVYGIRGEGKSATHRAEAFMKQKRFDATKIHTHTFALEDLPTAIRYAKDRVDDAIKVVVTMKPGAVQRVAAE